MNKHAYTHTYMHTHTYYTNTHPYLHSHLCPGNFIPGSSSVFASSPLTPCGQDPFWKVCMAKFADRKDELNKGLVDFSTIANRAAKHFAKNLPEV